MIDQRSPVPPVVLTGPGGWVGSAFLAALAGRRGAGWARGVSLFGSAARTLVAPDGTPLPVRPLADLAAGDVADALVVHLAFLTKDKVEPVGPRRFMDQNLAIDACVLDALAGGRPAGLFVASSGAARLAEAGVDRHPYGMAKLMQEDAFIGLARRSGVPALIGRIYNLGGPFINKVGSYALSSLLEQALAGGPVRVAAAVPVFRSYLHVADLCELVLRLLPGGPLPAGVVDLCGPRVVEMGEVALAAVRAVGRDPGVVERPPVDLTRPSRYLGAAADTLTLAMGAELVLRDFDEQVADTAAYLRGRASLLALPAAAR